MAARLRIHPALGRIALFYATAAAVDLIGVATRVSPLTRVSKPGAAFPGRSFLTMATYIPAQALLVYMSRLLRGGYGIEDAAADPGAGSSRRTERPAIRWRPASTDRSMRRPPAPAGRTVQAPPFRAAPPALRADLSPAGSQPESALACSR